jgi:hypothetical protein
MSFLSAPSSKPTETPLVLPPLESTDPDISAFYAQLSDRERVAHAIAILKLDTSYDVRRTHAFQKWRKSRM